MKTYAPIGIILALLLALTIAVCDGVKLKDRYSVLVGQYQEALKESVMLNAAKDQIIAENLTAIKAKDAEIAEATKKVGDLTNALGQRDQNIVALDNKLAAAKTDAERVPILVSLVDEWRGKYNTAVLIIDEKDKTISAWEGKFNAQVEVGEAWKAKYENETKLHQLARLGWSATASQLKRTRIISNLKTGAIIAAVGYFGFSALRGK